MLLPFLAAIAISFVSAPLVIFLAKRYGLVDDPALNKHPKVIHTYPVPRAGGAGILAAIVISSLIFLPLDKHLKGILAGAIFVVLVGIIDDKKNLSPYLRVLTCLIASTFPIAAGIGIAFIQNPLGSGIIDLSHPQISFSLLGEEGSIWFLSDAFALVWIFTLMNMINMGAKGVDGQLPGVVTIAALTIAALSLKFSADITQWPVIILAAVTAGAFLGFLPWNFYPQKIMPGYSGSTLAGFMLGVLSILSTSKVGTLLVVLGVPLIDTGYTIVRRILAGRSPVWGDRGHLHHRLLDAGLSKPAVSFIYWALTAVLGILALNLNRTNKFYTMIGVAVAVGGLILWLTQKSKKETN